LFTGLVQEIGTVARAWRTGSGRRIVVKASPRFCSRVAPGDSVMVNGCCQTLEEVRGGTLSFTAVPETLERTTLGGLAGGRRVNLELAATPEQALGGHIVTGHVDAVGEVLGLKRTRGGVELEVACPAEQMRFLAEKGSVAIDGVSLTVASVGTKSFSVALIPYTLEHTIAKEYRRGTRVNLEVDILARYAARLSESE